MPRVTLPIGHRKACLDHGLVEVAAVDLARAKQTPVLIASLEPAQNLAPSNHFGEFLVCCAATGPVLARLLALLPSLRGIDTNHAYLFPAKFKAIAIDKSWVPREFGYIRCRELSFREDRGHQ